ncbi:MAG: ATP-dependent DNA helicase RecG [Hyphomicrobiales bacterium]
MRPDILNPLFRPVASLPGIGPRLETTITRLLVGADSPTPARVIDLLLHLPSGIIDRRRQPGVALAPEGAIVTLKVRIDRHRPAPPGNSRAPARVFAHDDTGEIGLVFFHGNKSWLERAMPVGETRYVSGRVEWFNGAPQMVHPDHIVDEAGFAGLPLVEPVYPLTAGLSGKVLGRAVRAALEAVPELPEWIDPAIVAGHGFPPFAQALAALHTPATVADAAPDGPAASRLAYDELLAGQLALALVRAKLRKPRGKVRTSAGRLKAKILAALPFSLTPSQAAAVADIEADLARPERMLRLLQGDVGAGKTVVALAAMADAIESGGQAALMAPTELLARQHLRTIAPLAEAAGLRIGLLVGRDRAAARATLLAALAAGEIDIIIGTHAMFQEGVEFHDLALAVIDEQHRFGVHQRLALASKGPEADVLVMTATPIPRTLVLTYFGDMDVSRLTEKPAGRRPIDTRAVPLDRIGEVAQRIAAATRDGAKAYWVCPLVEESETTDLAAADARAADMRSLLGDRVGLVHGRMKSADKDEEMRRFQSGETRVLVATTVIEVGVDVPDATIMVIEHAERFGLAQLHQLRGRVGRGDAASTCLLLYKAPLGETARARLQVMRDTEDGFVIAEEDLRLRGEGEVLGTRQSGAPGFRVARPEFHGALLETARDEARLTLARDPDLLGERAEGLRMLLYLFGRDDAIRLLRAG